MVDRARLVMAAENLRAYIMVHGGIDRHDRLLDLELIEQALGFRKATSGPDAPEQAERGGGWRR